MQLCLVILQVIDDPGTFPETSCTSMTLYALARGVLQGWLTRDVTVDKAIMRAWDGLQSVVMADGTVHGICEGTGNNFIPLLHKCAFLFSLASDACLVHAKFADSI